MEKDTKNPNSIALDDNTDVVEAIITPAISAEDIELLKQMTEAGVHYGRRKSKTSPKMVDVIYATRNNIEVIDVSKTLEMLRSAVAFLGSVIEKGGTILVVGTQPAFRDVVEAFAKKFSFPVVTERWLGGTLTNFKTISTRITHLKKLKEDKSSGRLAKYVKKEQLVIQRDIDRLQKFLGGIETMTKLPEAVLLIDVELHTTALHEARKSSAVSVVGLLNTDGKHRGEVDYVIPGNTKGRASIEWILDYIAKELKDKRSQAPAEKVASTK